MSHLLTPHYRSEYTPSPFQIPEVSLTFSIFDGSTRVSSRFTIIRIDHGAQELTLNGVNLELLSLKINRKEIQNENIRITPDTLSINWNYGDQAVIEVENVISPEKNTALEGLYFASGFYCTQNEPMGFRHITYFLDRPDVMSSFSVRIEAEKKYPLLLSNGNKINSGSIDDTRHFVEWHDPHKKPTYLFALVAADLEEIRDTFTTMSGRVITLSVAVEPGRSSDALWAMESLKRAMRWDEERYGREYDLDIFHIVATDSFNMGAMENKSLNIFNTIYIRANPRTSTDRDFMDVEAVIGHEYFHNWTGNRITCRDWFQLTLKEGLTVFRDQNFSADMHSPVYQRISDIETLREVQFTEDQGMTAHPIQPDSYVEMNNFYTATVYDKGAEVIRMTESLLGRERFRKGMDLYFARHDGQAVTTHDFIQAIADGGWIDLTEFEESWYHQPRTPLLEATGNYDPQAKTYTLTLSQLSQKSPEGAEITAWYIPLAIALYHPETKELYPLDLPERNEPYIKDSIIIVKNPNEQYVFHGISETPKISLNRGFRAPIIVRSQDIDYRFLTLYETDGVSRYDAWIQYSIDIFREFLNTGDIDSQYIDTFITLLTDPGTDLLTSSLFVNFVSTATLLNQLGPISPSELSQKRDSFLLILGSRDDVASLLRNRFDTAYSEYISLPESIDDLSFHKRAYIAALASRMSESGILTPLDEQNLIDSSKMTLNLVGWRARIDRTGEIGLGELKKWMLDNGFFDDLLMRMKYFSLISQTDTENLLETLETEISGEYFSLTIPNLVRALIGGFARNYPVFHKKDGSGYAFYAGYIKKIDPINPQIAARLSKVFTLMTLVDEDTQDKIKKAISPLINDPEISRAVKEILTKVLS